MTEHRGRVRTTFDRLDLSWEVLGVVFVGALLYARIIEYRSQLLFIFSIIIGKKKLPDVM